MDAGFMLRAIGIFPLVIYACSTKWQMSISVAAHTVNCVRQIAHCDFACITLYIKYIFGKNRQKMMSPIYKQMAPIFFLLHAGYAVTV